MIRAEWAKTSAGGAGGLFGANYNESFLSLHLNRPLLGQRVADVLAVIQQVAKDSGDEIHLIGIGTAAPIALHVAALEPRIAQTTIENGLVSWTNALATPAKCSQLALAVPNALSVYDFPDLAALIAPRELNILTPSMPQANRFRKRFWKASMPKRRQRSRNGTANCS